MKKWLIAFIVILVLSVAIFIFIKQNDQDLGANYYYLPKYEAIDIGYPGGGIVYKSPQKGSFDEIIIHGNVIQAIANKQFIIAIQNADTSYIESDDQDILEMTNVNYFIIDKKNTIVNGPYTKDEYLLKRKELKFQKEFDL